MSLFIARRYPGVLRRLANVKRVPLTRNDAQRLAFSGLTNASRSGNHQSSHILPLRLKNGYATATKSSKGRTGSTSTAKKSTAKNAKSKTSSRNTKGKSTKSKSTKPKKTKKTAGRAKKPKKVLTAEEKEVEAKKAQRRKVKELKAIALTPPKPLPKTPLGILANRDRLRPAEAQEALRSISESEKSQLAETGQSNKAKNSEVLEGWVKTHSALEIKKANVARAHLRRLGYGKFTYADIKDDRRVKLPSGPFMIFMKESRAAGELDGLSLGAAGSRGSELWRNLSESEKQKYLQLAEEDRQRYIGEYKRQYHEEPNFVKRAQESK